METITIVGVLGELGRNSVQAGLLVLAVLLAQWLSGRRLSPHWRCALWLVVVGRLLVPFSLGSVANVFDLLPSRGKPAPVPIEMVALPAPSPKTLVEPFAPTTPISAQPVRSPETPLQIQSPAAVSVVAPVSVVPPQPSAVASVPMIPATPSLRWSWPVCLFWVWLAGVIGLLGHVLISSLRLGRRCAQLRPLSEPASTALLEACRKNLEVRTPLDLVETVEVNSPALHGLFRPRLLLPKGFTANFSAEELRFVFLHELAHLKRHDLWMNWVISILQAVHWFNPLVWLGFARWRADRELACDAMVLEATGADQNKKYGETILHLLENFTHPLRTPGLVGILEDKNQLRRRIGMIAGYVPAPRWSMLAVVLLAGLTLLGLTDARSDDSTKSSSAAAAVTGVRVTVELKDGSRVTGKNLDEVWRVRSASLGEIKMPLADIRAIESVGNSEKVRLATANGDALEVQFVATAIEVETSFGRTELPVKLIRNVKVSPMVKLPTPANRMLETAANPMAFKRVQPAATGDQIQLEEAAATKNNAASLRLTIELRDGSKVVGESVEKSLKFRAALLGDIKLAVKDVRSAEWGSTNSAKLTTVNGDKLTVSLVDAALEVRSSFGKVELPANAIRKLTVTAIRAAGSFPAGLVALWSGEGEGNDSVGGNNMTLTDMSFADGKVGQAFSFNGRSSYFTISDSPTLNVGAGEGFTISAWIKPKEIDGLRPIMEWEPGDKMPGLIGVSLWIGQDPGSQGILCGSCLDNSGRDNSANHYVKIPSPTGTLAAQTWQHVAYTYSKVSGDLCLYVNGNLVTRRQWGVLDPLTIGDITSFRAGVPGHWTYNRFFAGLMDELAIYSRALSEEEIQGEYNRQK